MKSKCKAIFIAAATFALFASYAQAQIEPRATGIGLRGSYWDMNSAPDRIVITDYQRYHAVEGGGAGGWISFFSRTSENWFMEFNLGAISREIESVSRFDGQDTRVMTVVPVLLGMRYHLFSPQSRSNIRPYVAFGAGPYWFADIFVHEEYWDKEEVTINSKLKAGGYAGGGLDFMLTSWFGLNLDVKYHFVDFNSNSDFSGYEYGLGLQFMWGKYRPGRRN